MDVVAVREDGVPRATSQLWVRGVFFDNLHVINVLGRPYQRCVYITLPHSKIMAYPRLEKQRPIRDRPRKRALDICTMTDRCVSIMEPWDLHGIVAGVTSHIILFECEGLVESLA